MDNLLAITNENAEEATYDLMRDLRDVENFAIPPREKDLRIRSCALLSYYARRVSQLQHENQTLRLSLIRNSGM